MTRNLSFFLFGLNRPYFFQKKRQETCRFFFNIVNIREKRDKKLVIF